MGKASRRRKKRRQQYLARVRKQDKDRFDAEWAKRLESWAREARRRAGRLTDEHGKPAGRAFAMVDVALKELEGCGQQAVDAHRESTMEIMNNECVQAVAAAVDKRMYRLNNAKANHYRMRTRKRGSSR